MAEFIVARWWHTRDKAGWRSFGIAMLVLSAALLIALFSAAAAQTGRIWLAGTTTAIALGLAGWVAINIVPTLARRTSLRWLVYQVDYRLLPWRNSHIRNPLSSCAHWSRTEIRLARPHFRRTARARRARAAKRKADLALVFTARGGRIQKNSSASAHSPRLFPLHSAPGRRTPKR